MSSVYKITGINSESQKPFKLIFKTGFHSKKSIIKMIINTVDGKLIDTESDLSSEERHVLQKLFLWESMAESIEQFRQKKKEALLKGWGSSGPVNESPALKSVIHHLEMKVLDRLSPDKMKI